MSAEYPTIDALARGEREGSDWRRICIARSSGAAILAPHGGGIEAGTSELARAIAGNEHSCYCFEGLKRRGNDALHIRSTAFDDPACLELLADADRVIALHGCADAEPRVYAGGLDEALRLRIRLALAEAGFEACDDDTPHAGHAAANICNRGRRGAGVQLELSTGLRAQFFAGLRARERATRTAAFDRFVDAVRAALASHLTGDTRV